MKSGIKTSEFWMALVPQIVTIGIAIGFFKAEASADLTTALNTVVGGVALVVSVYASFMSAVQYIKDRTYLKSKDSEETKK